jgi:2-phosphosulfolactate phosphatase
MKTIDVCLTPKLLTQHELAHQTVVVVDILRATSSMVTAFAHGAKQIVPVAHAEACRSWRKQGYLIAGERDGQRIDGFDLGNSPLAYQPDRVREQSLAMTTTNGTLTIEKARGAHQLLIGAFLNLEAVADQLRAQEHSVVVVCAGWKGHVNLEDTLFAGALVTALQGAFRVVSDSALMASMMYRSAQPNLFDALAQSSHVQRLQRLGCSEDIHFCLRQSIYSVVPVLRNNRLVA